MNKQAARMNAMLIPLSIVFLFLYIVPFILLFVYSFLTYNSGDLGAHMPLTLDSYAKFFRDSYYLGVIGRTFWLSIVTTLVSLLLAYPLAYFMSRTRGYLKTTMLVLVTLPLISGVMVQTMGWYGMLTNYGPVNNFLVAVGLVEDPVQLLGNSTAIVIGMVQGFMPYMVLPIMNVLQVIPQNVSEAAENLGAGRFQRFVRVTFPMSMGGVLAGCVLVFGACLSSYTTPSILGRGKVQVIGTVVYQQAMQLFNWPFASVIAMLLLLILVLLTPLSKLLSGRRGGAGE